ncbi:MAG: hypothetical protein WCX28_12655, partial [Bacteriovoracaceae bacterium]
SYAPLTILTYMIEYQIDGFNPALYHTTNVVMHIVNSCLVFWLAYLLSGNIMAVFIAGMLFGIHPMRVESVAWISGRKDVLSMFFFLLSSISYLRYIDSHKKLRLLLSFILFVCAILSKIIVLTFPLILLLFDFLKRREVTGNMLVEKIPFFVTAAVLAVVGVFGQVSVNAIKQSSGIVENSIVSLHGIMFYIEKFFIPVKLSHIYSYPKNLTIEYYLYAALVIPLVYYVWKYRKNDMLVFGSLFFIISLLPVLQLVRFSQIFAADRFTYFAYIGVFYIVGIGTAKSMTETNKWVIILLLVIVFCSFAFLTNERCRAWKDNDTLWKDLDRNTSQSTQKILNEDSPLLFLVQPVQHSGNKCERVRRTSGNKQVDRIIVQKFTI